jgi:hypothetical protein
MTEPGVGASPDGPSPAGRDGAELLPYEHDPAAGGPVAGLLDAAFSAAALRWHVTDHLRVLAANAGMVPEAPLLHEVILAVSYALRLNHAGDAAVDLRPQIEVEDFAWPPRIADVSPDVVALWRDLADLVQHPAARARFNDLLFVRRDGVERDRAVAAGEAYLAAAQSRSDADLDVTAYLVRAWDLARKVGAWAKRSTRNSSSEPTRKCLLAPADPGACCR